MNPNSQQIGPLSPAVSCIAVVGLGYVGLPIAVAFTKKGRRVIGFDINDHKITRLKQGLDDTGEVEASEFKDIEGQISFTSNPAALREPSFIIVAVPTPITEHKTPDLTPLTKACELIGKNVAKGSIIVFESTVYPGVTEEHCVPLIEKSSGYSFAKGDFFVGYSPERINPGDKQHTLAKITKVVSGQNAEICDVIASVYSMVVEAGVYKAQSIKVAEAAKVIENTQRDLNIALMNELAVIFGKMGISTQAVLEAAGTKWNFLKFVPGLVGGHCIGVDPYYLTCKAEQLGYHPQVVLAGRRINDSMGVYIAQQAIKQMVRSRKIVEDSRILVLGLTFKENVPDFRNSRVVDIIRELKSCGAKVCVHDPFWNEGQAEECDVEGVEFVGLDSDGYDGIIVSTPHDQFKKLTPASLMRMCRAGHGSKPVLIDVKWVFDQSQALEAGFNYWRL